MEEFDGQYLLISSDVWLLGGGEPRILSPEEIKELPVIICWKGEPCHFQADKEKAIGLLCQIVTDMNLMQNPKFVSFPLGNKEIL